MPNKFKLLLICFFAAGSLKAQNLLPEKWKFKTSDDTSFANPETIDSTWQLLNTGATWESQGIKDYDGFAWYRASVFIPEKLKADALKYGGLILNLGKVDDVDYSYWNGKLIGKTGEFPPKYESKYDIDRVYSIPMGLIGWNQFNTIAVRVYDHSGSGGINGSPAELKLKDVADYFLIEPKFANPDHIMVGKDTTRLRISVKNFLSEQLEGKLSIEIASDFGDKLAIETKEIVLNPQASTIAGFFIKDMKPGFYNCTLLLQSNLGSKVQKFSFGFNPEKIVSPTDRNADFEVYWDDAKKELATVAPNYKLTLVDSLSKGKRNIYVVEMQSIGNVKVKAWYAVPKKAGKYPAILHLQGYSGFMNLGSMYSGDDIIAMGLNVRGHGFSQVDFNPGFPGYLLSGIEDKEKYVYRGAYMDTRRAVEFLFSRPEIDTTKVAVEGGSQGGALSIATAALNNSRISLCLPHVPFLSDFRDYFKTANWPNNEFTAFEATTLLGSTWDNIFNTLSYIDIKNLAEWIKCPTFMAVGLIDDVCPPHINFAAYNHIGAAKEYKVYPLSGHGLPTAYHILKYKWLKKQWGMNASEASTEGSQKSKQVLTKSKKK